MADEAIRREPKALWGNAEYLHRIKSPAGAVKHGGKGRGYGGKRVIYQNETIKTVPYGPKSLDSKTADELANNLVLRLHSRDGGDEESLKRLVDECLTPLDRMSRLRVLDGVQKQHDDRVKKVAVAREELNQLQSLDSWIEALPEKPSIEKNDCSRLHKFKQAVKDSKLLGLANGQYEVIKEKTAFVQDLTHTFVVRHDWASAFEKSNIGNDDVRFPYDLCTFEFRVMGRTLICLAANIPSELRGSQWSRPNMFHCFAECGDFWVSMGDDKQDGVPLMATLWAQIRAICIALDAEVATSEVIRQSEKLNKKRIESGKTPLVDYHVVDLSKRHRIANPASLGSTHKSPRLHFVRGHWRHLENAKVWIKWHLRGNPDLGYIQKEYAL